MQRWLIPLLAYIVTLFIPTGLALFLYLWSRGWIPKMSELSPIYAKIALILSIVFLVAGVGASIALGVMWFKYSRNESPSGQQFSNFDKRLKNIEKMLGAINKTLGKK